MFNIHLHSTGPVSTQKKPQVSGNSLGSIGNQVKQSRGNVLLKLIRSGLKGLANMLGLKPTVSHLNVTCGAKNFSSLKIAGLDNISVSGMAQPVVHNKCETIDHLDAIFQDVVKDCSEDSKPTLVSLDDRYNDDIKDSWKAVSGGNWKPLIVEDFHPLSVDQMVSLAKTADECNENGNDLFIHCGEGFGRTGTMIASLILRQLIKEKPEASNEKNVKLDMPSEHSKVKEVKTTPIVARAIQLSRINYAETSVEMDKQVAALEKYQNYLQNGGAYAIHNYV